MYNTRCKKVHRQILNAPQKNRIELVLCVKYMSIFTVLTLNKGQFDWHTFICLKIMQIQQFLSWQWAKNGALGNIYCIHLHVKLLRFLLHLWKYMSNLIVYYIIFSSLCGWGATQNKQINIAFGEPTLLCLVDWLYTKNKVVHDTPISREI